MRKVKFSLPNFCFPKRVGFLQLLPMVLLCCLDIYCQKQALADEIRIRAPLRVHDVGHGYYVQLLQIALDKAPPDHQFSVVTINHKLSHARALRYLNENNFIDVDWVGTNKRREQDLMPIRIPLTLGLLGLRLLAIAKEKKPLFQRISKVEELKKLRACQSTHWPDRDILILAGFNVISVGKF